MSTDSTDREAVDSLEQLGLTEYEARCLVSLTKIPSGTAKEISQLSTVPRSRVYDTVERLHQRGLVDVQQSEPRQYKAVSIDAAIETLRQQYEEGLETAKEHLKMVESVPAQEDSGAWAIAEHEHVTNRMISLIDEATSEVHLLVADEELLSENLVSRLIAADDRGVDVLIELPSASLRERLVNELPGATVVVSGALDETIPVQEKHAGQALLVDRQHVLLSALAESDLPGIKRETAIWSKGTDHGLAVWIREFLSEHRERIERESDEA